MKFSVLIPVYINDTVEQFSLAVESVLNQSLKADEILVLIDGPIKDDLKCKIDEFSKQHTDIRPVFFSQNRGLPATLNDGLKLAKNEIVFRMDADDVCLLDRFEKQLIFLTHHPEVDVLGGQIREFTNRPQFSESARIVPSEHGDIKKFSKTRNPINHPTVAFRKSVVLSVGGYDENLKYFEDWGLWVKLLIKGCKFHNLPDVLCYMRTDSSFLGRRSGLSYVTYEMTFLKFILKNKFISKFQFLKLASTRIPVRLLPITIISMVYKVALRSK